MRKTILTRTTAAVFGATLLFGVAACSTDEAQDAASDATDAVSTAAEDARTAIDDATNNDGNGDGGNEGADVDTESVEEADLPPEIGEAAGNAEAEGMPLGEFKSAERAGDNYLVEYENGWVASGPDTGAHVIKGKIAETWANDGGLGNEVGLPTAPEMEIEGGWEQTFANGKIMWTQDEDGEFSAKYE